MLRGDELLYTRVNNGSASNEEKAKYEIKELIRDFRLQNHIIYAAMGQDVTLNFIERLEYIESLINIDDDK